RWAAVPDRVGFVDVSRPPAPTPEVARRAVAAGASALWLQLGIASAEARAIAEEAGLLYVENRCLSVEQRRLGLGAPCSCGTAAGRGRPRSTTRSSPRSRGRTRTSR